MSTEKDWTTPEGLDEVERLLAPPVDGTVACSYYYRDEQVEAVATPPALRPKLLQLIATARQLNTLRPLLAEWARTYDRETSQFGSQQMWSQDNKLRAAIPAEWLENEDKP